MFLHLTLKGPLLVFYHKKGSEKYYIAKRIFSECSKISHLGIFLFPFLQGKILATISIPFKNLS